MQDANFIPQDLETAQRLLLELSAHLQSREVQLRDREVLVDEQSRTLVELQQCREQLEQDNETLKLTIEKLLRQLYGNRRERVTDDPNQLKLDFAGDPAARDALADAAVEAERIIQEYTVRRQVKKAAPPREETFPAHLPRVEKTVEVPDDAKTCQTHGPRQLIGYDTTETLVFERPKLHVQVTECQRTDVGLSLGGPAVECV
jgi:hypothetical protein